MEKAGRFVEAKRKQLGMTQSQLAGKLHVTRQAVYKWERGKSFPAVDTLMLMADVFGVSVEEIVAAKEEPSVRPASAEPPAPPSPEQAYIRPGGEVRTSPVLRGSTGGLLCLPAVLLAAGMLVVPFILMAYVGFTDFNMLESPRWVGLQNYANLLGNDVFRTCFTNTAMLVPLSLLVLGLSWLLAKAAAALPRWAGVGLGALLCAASISLLFPAGVPQLFQSQTAIGAGTPWLFAPRLLYLLQLGGICLGPLYLLWLYGFSQGEPVKRHRQGYYHIVVSLLPVLLVYLYPYATAVFGFPSAGYAVDTLMSIISDYCGVRFEMGMGAATIVVLVLLLLVWLAVLNGAIAFLFWLNRGKTLLSQPSGRVTLAHGIGFAGGCLFALLLFLPALVNLSTSLKPMDELFLFPPGLFPRHPSADSYATVGEAMDGGARLGASVWPLLLSLAYYLLILVPPAVGLAFSRSRYKALGFGLACGCYVLSPVADFGLYLLFSAMGLSSGGMVKDTLSAYVTNPFMPVFLLAAVWALRRGAAGAASLRNFLRDRRRGCRTAAALLGVGILSSLPVYFDGGALSIRSDYSSLFVTVEGLGSRVGTQAAATVMATAAGIALLFGGLALLLFIARPAKEEETKR